MQSGGEYGKNIYYSSPLFLLVNQVREGITSFYWQGEISGAVQLSFFIEWYYCCSWKSGNLIHFHLTSRWMLFHASTRMILETFIQLDSIVHKWVWFEHEYAMKWPQVKSDFHTLICTWNHNKYIKFMIMFTSNILACVVGFALYI